jgi:hypothetical protein
MFRLYDISVSSMVHAVFYFSGSFFFLYYVAEVPDILILTNKYVLLQIVRNRIHTIITSRIRLELLSTLLNPM